MATPRAKFCTCESERLIQSGAKVYIKLGVKGVLTTNPKEALGPEVGHIGKGRVLVLSDGAKKALELAA